MDTRKSTGLNREGVSGYGREFWHVRPSEKLLEESLLISVESGYQTVLGLAKRNAKVYIGARSKDKGAAAIESIRSVNACANVAFVKMDLMDLRSIVKAADEIKGYVPSSCSKQVEFDPKLHTGRRHFYTAW